MTETSTARRYGAVFDTVAAEYDRHRPTYPDELIDLACQAGGLAAGDRVLEIGCGTGQLTRGLVARGLSVTAVEPGQNLISLARQVAPGVNFVNRRFEDAELPDRFAAAFCAAAFHWLDPDVSWGKVARSLAPGGVLALIQYCGVDQPETAADADALLSALAAAAPDVDFVNRRFEDAELPDRFAAAFCAAAFHWLDPDVSWRKVARSLAPGGVLALIQYCGVNHPDTAADADALLSALAATAPEMAADWPPLRDLETIMAGVRDRRANVSEVWAWVGGQPVARSYAAELFEDAAIAVVPSRVEQTADEINALLRTTSLYPRLPVLQQQALEKANRDIGERLGRPIRSSMLAVLVTARRALDSPATR